MEYKDYKNHIQNSIVEYNKAVDNLLFEIASKLKVNPEAYSVQDMLKTKAFQSDILMKQYRNKLKKTYEVMYDAYTVDLEKFREEMEKLNLNK
jgi:tRNA A37 threonylcarbamoyladenosine dehydratase